MKHTHVKFLLVYFLISIVSISNFAFTGLYPIQTARAVIKDLPTNQIANQNNTTTPITEITSAFDGSRNAVARSGTTASGAITFTFVSTNISPSSVTFQCSLDNLLPTSFTACTSPKSYSNLRLGVHFFRVQSQSTAGVTGTPDNFVWTIQSTSLFGTNISSSTTIKAVKNNIGNSSLPATFARNEIINAPCVGGLPCGYWSIISNGLTANASHGLYIRSVDNQGKITGSIFGHALNGTWDPISQKINFITTIFGIRGSTVSFSGFYHNICGIGKPSGLFTSGSVGLPSCLILTGTTRHLISIVHGPSDRNIPIFQQGGWIAFYQYR